MSTSSLENLALKLDQQYEKTGVVLVGMHQELQEQRSRVGAQQAQVAQLSQALDQKIDLIAADLRTRADAAMAGFTEIEPLLERLTAGVREADVASAAARANLDALQQTLPGVENSLTSAVKNLALSMSEQAQTFTARADTCLREVERRHEASLTTHRQETTRLTQATEESLSTLSRKHLEMLEAVRGAQQHATEALTSAHQEALQASEKEFSLALARIEHRLQDSLQQYQQAVQASLTSHRNELDAGQAQLLAQQAANTALLESHKKAIETGQARLLAQQAANTALLESHKKEIEEGQAQLLAQQATNTAFLETLRAAVTQHQAREAAFARRTRHILAGLLATGLLGLGALAYALGVLP